MPNYRYSNQEYLNMSICYAQSGEVLSRAQTLYEVRHGSRPSTRTILGAVQRHRESGNFQPRTEAGRSPYYPARVDEEIMRYFAENPHASSQDAARVFDVGSTYGWRLLRNEGQHPYKPTPVQELGPPDYEARMSFCSWLLQRGPENILWTDESTFTRVGLFNVRNTHYWAETNPHVVRPSHFQHRFSVNVWAGVLGENLLGPIFLGRLNGASYLEFLQNDLRDMLQEVPLEDRQEMFFQQDGAPAHFSRQVRDYLDSVFGEKWIGRGGSVPWPARSPDLTPCDFYLWGRVKDMVYGSDGHTIQNANELQTRIVNAFTVLRSERNTLARVREHCFRRAVLCLEQEGKYVQQLLN